MKITIEKVSTLLLVVFTCLVCFFSSFWLMGFYYLGKFFSLIALFVLLFRFISSRKRSFIPGKIKKEMDFQKRIINEEDKIEENIQMYERFRKGAENARRNGLSNDIIILWDTGVNILEAKIIANRSIIGELEDKHDLESENTNNNHTQMHIMETVNKILDEKNSK